MTIILLSLLGLSLVVHGVRSYLFFEYRAFGNLGLIPHYRCPSCGTLLQCRAWTVVELVHRDSSRTTLFGLGSVPNRGAFVTSIIEVGYLG